MKILYAFSVFAFLFAGAGVFAETPVAVDGIGEISTMAEQPDNVICENDPVALKNQGEPDKGSRAGTVTITNIELEPILSITAFGLYSVHVDVTKDVGVTIDEVNLTATPLSYAENDLVQGFKWNYYTWLDEDNDQVPSDNQPIARTIEEDIQGTNVRYSFTGSPAEPFGGIRPDDIYPEIHFATDEITHNKEPDDEPIRSNNIQLMKFNNPFTMGDGTSFFIEFYAEPNNPNPPPPVNLQVYLVGRDVVSSTFGADNWIEATNAVLVGTIGRDDDFDHNHGPNSKHHLVRLSSDTEGKVAGLDVNPDFWVVLTAGTTDDRRRWNLKYHVEGDIEGGTNNDTWFKRLGTDNVEAQIGFPDVHVHLARNQGQEILVDGLELFVEVEYKFNGTNQLKEQETKFEFFGSIGNLPPNASSFIGPLADVYEGNVDISWNPATDPNNDKVKYNLYLFDVGTQTDVFEIATLVDAETFSFNTSTIPKPPGDGVYNIRIVACDDDGACSSSFFLYDIYDIGEEFVIANNPFNWTGGTDSNWDNADNWNKDDPPGENDLAFILGSASQDLVIGNDIDAKARRLSIEPGRTVTITAGGRLKVTQSLVNADAANLVVEPDASLIHNTPWPSAGVPATVQQSIPASTGDWIGKSFEPDNWYWISPPVSGQNIEDFLGVLLTDSEKDYDLYRWGESGDLWWNYKATPGVPDNEFAHVDFMPGIGYLFAATTSLIFDYTGALNSGDWVFSGLTNMGNGEDELFDPGWNLVGNPYASGIKFHEDWWKSADGSIALTPKFWVESKGSYEPYEENAIIPPKTAFFVQVNPVGVETASFTISKEARAHPTAEKQQHNPNYIVLESSPVDGNTAQRAYVRRAPKAFTSFDYRYDARFQPGYAPLFFSLKEEKKLQVHSISAIHDELVIPFYFLPNDEGPMFSISLLNNIEELELYLVDLHLDITHKITGENPYVFLSDPDDDPIRFELHFSAPSNDDDDDDGDPTSIRDTADRDTTRMWHHNNRLYIQTTETGTRLTIYDINGGALQTYQPEPGLQSYHINLPPGVYIARLNGNNTHETLKIITTNTP